MRVGWFKIHLDQADPFKCLANTLPFRQAITFIKYLESGWHTHTAQHLPAEVVAPERYELPASVAEGRSGKHQAWGCLQAFFPFNERYISSRLVSAPVHHSQELPRISLESRDRQAKEMEQLTFQPHLPSKAYLGAMNITGPITSWSLPPVQTPPQNMVSTSSVPLLDQECACLGSCVLDSFVWKQGNMLLHFKCSAQPS